MNAAQVDRDIELIEKIRHLAWQRTPEDLQGLADRLRVKLMTEKMPRRRRHFYRGVIDYFDDVLEERYEKEESADPARAKRSALRYVRDILSGLDD